MPTTAAHPRRRDARGNRDAILDAARELFAESPDIPLCRIAQRAGVGQATLYRNFASREALTAELLDEGVARIAALAAEQAGDPDAIFVLLRAIVDDSPHLRAFRILAREDAAIDSHLRRARERLADILRGPLLAAKRVGAVRREVSVDDLLLLFSMISGATEGVPQPGARIMLAHRVLGLLLSGIEVPPSPGDPGPGPRRPR